MKFAIIEDDRVEQMFYQRFFSKLDDEFTLFGNFNDFENSNESFDYLLSDFYVEGETVEDWLHLFDEISGVILSNANQTPKIKAAGISVYPKPLTIQLFEQIKNNYSLKDNSIIKIAQRVTIIPDFCETDQEAKEMLVILLENLKESSIKVLEKDKSLTKKFFYHNLINHIRYFVDNSQEELFLRELENKVVSNQEIKSAEFNRLGSILQFRISQLKSILAE